MKKLFVFFIAVALIAAFSVPAAAGDAEWSFYGSARMQTWYDDDSKEVAAVHTPADDDQDMTWDIQGNSRIGANVSAGDVGGRFEYGTGINLRLLYGTWNFGGGTLLVGQTYSPLNIFISNQVYGADSDMLNIGGVYGGRQPVIQLKFGSFKIALVKISTGGADAFTTATPASVANIAGVVTAVAAVPAAIPGGEVDTMLPKIELAYNFKTDMFNVGVVAGYNSIEIEGDAKSYDLDSWVVGLHGGVNLGPAYIKADIFQGQNTGDYGLWIAGDSTADFTTKIEDKDTLGYLLVGGVKLSDAFSLEGGYGFVSHESGVTGEKDDDTMAYYVQATIGLAPGVFITPEIGKIDYDKDNANAKEGDTLYFGAKWQINF
jgi:hypothetical protein